MFVFHRNSIMEMEFDRLYWRGTRGNIFNWPLLNNKGAPSWSVNQAFLFTKHQPAADRGLDLFPIFG